MFFRKKQKQKQLQNKTKMCDGLAFNLLTK